MNTTYKKILSPFHPGMKTMRDNTINIQDKNHPVRDEISKICRESLQLDIKFEEDIETLNASPKLSGLVCLKCSISKDGQLVAFGRSEVVFSKFNRYVSHTLSTALHGSFLSACNNFCKVYESLRSSESEVQTVRKFEESRYEETEPVASEKQISFLNDLISEGNLSQTEKLMWQNRINGNFVTRNEASRWIASLLEQR